MDIPTRARLYLEALCDNHESHAHQIIQSALIAGLTPGQIYLDIFEPAMLKIRQLWEENTISLAQERLATAITDRLVGELSPLFTPQHPRQQSIILGCVEGEDHVLELRMLADMFKAEGWHVLFLGANVPTDEWEPIALRTQPNAVALSISTRRLLPQARQIIERIRRCCPKSQIVVAGRLFRSDIEPRRQIDADICSPDMRQILSLLGAHTFV